LPKKEKSEGVWSTVLKPRLKNALDPEKEELKGESGFATS